MNALFEPAPPLPPPPLPSRRVTLTVASCFSNGPTRRCFVRRCVSSSPLFPSLSLSRARRCSLLSFSRSRSRSLSRFDSRCDAAGGHVDHATRVSRACAATGPRDVVNLSLVAPSAVHGILIKRRGKSRGRFRGPPRTKKTPRLLSVYTLSSRTKTRAFT